MPFGRNKKKRRLRSAIPPFHASTALARAGMFGGALAPYGFHAGLGGYAGNPYAGANQYQRRNRGGLFGGMGQRMGHGNIPFPGQYPYRGFGHSRMPSYRRSGFGGYPNSFSRRPWSPMNSRSFMRRPTYRNPGMGYGAQLGYNYGRPDYGAAPRRPYYPRGGPPSSYRHRSNPNPWFNDDDLSDDEGEFEPEPYDCSDSEDEYSMPFYRRPRSHGRDYDVWDEYDDDEYDSDDVEDDDEDDYDSSYGYSSNPYGRHPPSGVQPGGMGYWH